MNYLKEQLAIWKLKRSLHTYTRMDRAFFQSARTRFITLTEQRAPAGVRIRHSMASRYATIAVVGVLAMTSGLSVFADANNVSATHPLYEFKRLSEAVRLDLSTPEQQLELHKLFAQRRLDEVSELKTNADDHPILPATQNQINELDKEFQHEIDNGFDQTQVLPGQAQKRAKFCDDILKAIQAPSRPHQPPAGVITQIKARCGDGASPISSASTPSDK